jgi:hypothetical protein
MVVWGMGIVKYPDMPMDPGSLAGRVYFLCDAVSVVKEGVLEGVEEKSKSGKEDEKRYGFGEMIGSSGTRGVRVFERK